MGNQGEQVWGLLSGRWGFSRSVIREDSPADLLDRAEAADLLNISVGTFGGYRHETALRAAVRVVGGVEHWPRAVLEEWSAARPGDAGKRVRGGRPRGTGDLLPREEIRPRLAQLLDLDPAVTAAAAADVIGVHPDTATRTLAALRAEAVGPLLAAQPSLTAADVTRRLRFPGQAASAALAAAQGLRRAEEARAYVLEVTGLLGAAAGGPPDVLAPVRGAASLAVPLAAGESAAALVWDERWGWRTAPTRADVQSTATPPTGDAVRYLGARIAPQPADVVAAYRGRGGRRAPAVTRLPGESLQRLIPAS
ncbi:DUF6292 family protein [Streptomyces sp. NPDC060194]|uniref:DUF6292 family protein n=1 Tax=Streptomyces sp. NPDC060194 TaxID=3347069 RepID=UPI003653362D